MFYTLVSLVIETDIISLTKLIVYDYVKKS